MFASCRSFLVILCLSCCVEMFSLPVKTAVCPSGFIENKGQVRDQHGNTNEDVLFLFSLPGMNVQLRRNGYSYELFSAEDLPVLVPGMKYIPPGDLRKMKLKTSRVDILFSGSDGTHRIETEGAKQEHLNYFISGKAITGIHSFQKVTYRNVYPFTDIEFFSDPSGNAMKYNIILHEGADIGNVSFLVKGAEAAISGDGSMVLSTPLGLVAEAIPASYSLKDPGKNETVEFVLDANRVSFRSKAAPVYPFVIDPSSNRIWGAYFGGSTLDYATATGLDAASNVYVGGYTLSTSGIASSGAYQSTISGSYDIFLAKFDPAGNRIWSTYYGAGSVETAYGMYVSPAGMIYLCGDTFSVSGLATAGAHQTSYGGGIDDALLVKFDSAGMLKWATYYGGTMHDIAIGVTEDASGNVILAGHTESATAIATAGSYNDFFYGGFDVFVAKFDSAGTRQWGTYYGEIDLEEAFFVTCDPADNIYVTGFTTSTNNIATASGFQTGLGGQQDAFIAKFNPAGTTLLYGSYYGGPGIDQGTCIRLNTAGDIFLSGNTSSLVGISAPGAWQPSAGSADDSFLARFAPAGTRTWATYFGGDDVDYIAAFVLDGNGQLLLCGSTMSTNVISTPGAWQPAIGMINNYDAFFERFSASGSRLTGSYYGGSAGDHGRGITSDAFGKIYVCGESNSNSAIASSTAYDTTWSGADDGFLAKFCLAPQPQIFPSGTTILCENDTLMISVQSGFAYYLWNNGNTINPLSTEDTLGAGTYSYAVTVSDGTGCDAVSDTATVIVDLCTGLADLNAGSLQVWPVPASDVVFVRMEIIPSNESVSVEIYASGGQLVLQEQGGGPLYRADIKKLSPGIYILKVRAGDALFYRRFMKE